VYDIRRCRSRGQWDSGGLVVGLRLAKFWGLCRNMAYAMQAPFQTMLFGKTWFAFKLILIFNEVSKPVLVYGLWAKTVKRTG